MWTFPTLAHDPSHTPLAAGDAADDAQNPVELQGQIGSQVDPSDDCFHFQGMSAGGDGLAA